MSFQQGLSGLNATSKNLEVIGNNIANANTYGAKVSRAEFSDIYAAALNGSGSTAVGIGTNLAAVAQQFSQGNITTTQNGMDLAINGTGFFQVADTNGLINYTRNGQFKLDRDGFIVNNTQQRLMGYPANDVGQIQPGQAGPLQLPTGGIAPSGTGSIAMEMNFDARLGATAPTAGPAIVFNDADTYNNATSLTVYDAKGQEVAMTYFFQKSADDNWNVFATANGISVNGTNAAPLPVVQIQFQPDGRGPLAPVGPVVMNVPASTNSAGAATMAIPGVEINISRITQFGSSFGVTGISQDGSSAGQLTSIAIEPNGVVSARYSNGLSRPAGQIEIAIFRNPQGLQPMGNNAWASTNASGTPVLGTPGGGRLGVLQAGALEESNVELTGELVSMITAQRIYQANAQTIKTQDQVLQTLVNLR